MEKTAVKSTAVLSYCSHFDKTFKTYYYYIVMTDKILTCAFTGHRPEKLPWGSNETDERCLALKIKISQAAETAYRHGCRRFICGMARGCDMYFFDAVVSLREKFSDVVIEAALPFEDQSIRWSNADAARWEAAIRSCDAVTLVAKEYRSDCYALRNKYMVDNADLLISVYDGCGGGTGQTVKYAESLNLRIMSLWL